jgi:FAD/FMN-containing dehydrogenase
MIIIHYVNNFRRRSPTLHHSMKVMLNDVHSQLNPVTVDRIERPESLSELQAIVRRVATASGARLSIAGGRHAMGGQQFGAGSTHIDTTGLVRVLATDGARGLLRIEAGADWPKIIQASHAIDGPTRWGIRQKQTGVDAVTLGGSISANAHGRGLLMQPLGDDIEDLTLIDATGDIVTCSRDANPELFSLVIGGYGLFGVIYAATLRLAPRVRVRRLVDIIDLDDAMNAVMRRAADGCIFGDFQFVIDAVDEGFLRRGVFACYKPSDAGGPEPDSGSDLPPEAWLALIELTHTDKRRAFQLYAQHYLATDGRNYWSDTHQLSTYIPSYADVLAERTRSPSSSPMKETLVIGEHYVAPERLLDFMQAAREIFRRFGSEVIYGTIRAIRRDTVSFLPWARGDYACVIFNIRTRHDEAGLQRTAHTFRALMDACIALDGSFFLTYHRHASISQVLAAHPRFREFLQLKKKYDPEEIFTSDWYLHYRDALAASGLMR